MRKKEKVFLFDLDDTLMWNEYTYSLAAIEFFEFLIRIFNNRLPFIGGIAKRVEEISHQLVSEVNPKTGKSYGFSMNRFPETLVRCYKELCQNGWGEFNQIFAEDIQNIGLKAFDENLYEKTGLVPGALETLSFLRKQDWVRLVLLTKGDAEVQTKKIRALNLKQMFLQLRIVDYKDTDLFKTWKIWNPVSDIFSVGNSFSSDIKPALDAGISAIFIPCYTWKAESIDQEKLSRDTRNRLWVIKEIREIMDIYDQL